MKMWTCRFCSKLFRKGKNSNGFYCSNRCQADEKVKFIVDKYLNDSCFENFYDKSEQPRNAIRMHFIKVSGCKCSSCGWDKKYKDNIYPVLEIDHADGDWKNCDPSNVRVLCPNCHSLTDTYKNRNKGRGREYRRQQ